MTERGRHCISSRNTFPFTSGARRADLSQTLGSRLMTPSLGYFTESGSTVVSSALLSPLDASHLSSRDILRVCCGALRVRDSSHIYSEDRTVRFDRTIINKRRGILRSFPLGLFGISEWTSNNQGTWRGASLNPRTTNRKDRRSRMCYRKYVHNHRHADIRTPQYPIHSLEDEAAPKSPMEPP